MSTSKHDVRKYHLHTPGVLYIAVTILLGFAAINSQNNLLFWIFGIGISGILVSGVISGAALMGLSVRQRPIAAMRAGENASARYAIETGGRFWPVLGLHIEQEFVDEDRAFVAQGFLPHLAAGSRAIARAHVAPGARGIYRPGMIRVWTTFPFGIIKKSLEFEPGPAPVSVAPRRLAIRPGVLSDHASSGHRAVQQSNTRHSDGEFFALREYVAGDARRAIAWKPTARTGVLLTREHSLLSSREVHLAIIATDREQTERVLELACAIAEQCSDEGIRITLAWTEAGAESRPGLLRAFAAFDVRSAVRAEAPPEAMVVEVGAGPAGQPGSFSIDEPGAWALSRPPEPGAPS